MKKWKAVIPPPSAARLTERTVKVRVDDGWGPADSLIATLASDCVEFLFLLDDSLEFLEADSALDAPTFEVLLTSSNPAGTRTETVSLTPVLLQGA